MKTLVIDTIGCGVGAWDERPVRICREIALSVARPGDRHRHRAADDNGTRRLRQCAAFRYLDFNDTYVGRFAVHPSDNIAACLAVAEAERASARELITAIVIAYEVNCRLVDALDISTRGWDPPVFGLPAVALAAGRLMKLSPDQLAHAVGIAINDHIPMAQTRVGALSDWKGLAAAEAGRNAVFAARLARAGLTGPAPIFEGSSGFFAAGVRARVNVDVESFGAARRAIPAPPMQSEALPGRDLHADRHRRRQSRSPRRLARSTVFRRSRSRRHAGAISAQEASLRNGRPKRERPPITAFPTSRRERCSTATSPMKALRRRNFAILRSSPSCRKSRWPKIPPSPRAPAGRSRRA